MEFRRSCIDTLRQLMPWLSPDIVARVLLYHSASLTNCIFCKTQHTDNISSHAVNAHACLAYRISILCFAQRVCRLLRVQLLADSRDADAEDNQREAEARWRQYLLGGEA